MVLKLLPVVLSFFSLTVSLLTFSLLYVPIQDLSYAVPTVQPNSLPVVNQSTGEVSFDDAFDIQLTAINRGNQSATISSVSIYIMPVGKSESHSNNACVREDQHFQMLYLFEQGSVEPAKMRGTSTTGDFGRKSVSPFPIPAHTTTPIEYRFALFDQENPGAKSGITGLLCVNVGVVTSYGDYIETPEALEWLDIQNGEHLMREKNMFRLNASDFSHKVNKSLNAADVSGLKSQVVVRELERNWFSNLTL